MKAKAGGSARIRGLGLTRARRDLGSGRNPRRPAVGTALPRHGRLAGTSIRLAALVGALACLALLASPGSRAFAELPDGRAYEQVSPVDKNGGSVDGVIGRTAASPEGSRIIFESHTMITGENGGAQEWSRFLSQRGADGWWTEDAMPPESLGQKGRVLGWSDDLSEVFSEAAEFKGFTKEFMLRSSLDGSTTTIVPPISEPLPNFRFVGTSADGSTVIFMATGNNSNLTPNAPTAKGNYLYAWNRDSKELAFVGVLPNGIVPGSGAAPGAYQWWSATGSPYGLWIPYNQELNTTTLDGSVFFTAGAIPRIYLRENPAEPETSTKDLDGNCVPDPVLACSVPISTTQKDNGAGPGGEDPNGDRAAAFMGATADGSKVLFTSSAEMTNDANTGPSPELGRADLDDPTTTQDLAVAAGNGVAVDGSHVYWANPGTNTIGRANLDGTDVNPAFITKASRPEAVAVEGSYIYWTNAGEGANGEGTIGRANLNGTSATEDFITGASNPQGIAVDSDYIYWVNAGTTGATKKLERADIEGTGPTEALTGNNTTIPTGFSGLAVDGSNIYWARGATIARAGLTGTGVNTRFITGTAGAAGVAVAGGHLYWSNSETGTIGRAELAGTPIEQSFVSTSSDPTGVAVDGAHVYWLANPSDQASDLYQYDVPDDTLTDLTPDSSDPDGADVRGVLGASSDQSYVYFAANGVLTSEPNSQGESAAPGTCAGAMEEEVGTCNVYLAHAGKISFVARMTPTRANAEDEKTNWTPSSSVGGTILYQKSSRVSASGSLAFTSFRKLTSYENSGATCVVGEGEHPTDPKQLDPGACSEIYLYSGTTGKLSCVSCNPIGEAPFGSAELTMYRFPYNTGSGATSSGSLSRNISADGDRVFFQTPDALVPEDTNGGEECRVNGTSFNSHLSCEDVYEWEADGSGSCHSDDQNGGCLYLISSGKSREASQFVDASASGSDAFFTTWQGLVGQDKDHLVDIYDARIGGGFASQNPPERVPCEGEGCKPTVTPPPASQSAGTTTFSGPPNPEPVRQHHKKKKKKQKHRKHKKRHGKRNKRHGKGHGKHGKHRRAKHHAGSHR